MDAEQMMLRDCTRTLYKVDKDGKPFCREGVSVYMEGLSLWRYDFQEYERNRDGVVERRYVVSIVNTAKLCRFLNVESSLDLIRELKRQFGYRVGYADFIENFKKFCDTHGVKYECHIWY